MKWFIDLPFDIDIDFFYYCFFFIYRLEVGVPLFNEKNRRKIQNGRKKREENWKWSADIKCQWICVCVCVCASQSEPMIYEWLFELSTDFKKMIDGNLNSV